MAVMYGADAEELEQIAAELDGYERELGQLLLEGVGAVSLVGLSATLKTIWMGNRASEFAGIWEARHLLRIREVQAMLKEAAGDLRKNAVEQRLASQSSGHARSPAPGGRAGSSTLSAERPRYVTSRVGLESDSNFGFIVHSDYESSVYTDFYSDGSSEVTVEVYQGTKLKFDDVLLLKDLGVAVTSLVTEEAGVKLDFSAEVDYGTRTTFGWSEENAGVASHFLEKKRSFSNNFGGDLGTDDVAASLNAEEVPQFDSFRRTTASVGAEISIGAKQEVVGGLDRKAYLRGEGSAEVFQGYLPDGSRVEGLAFELAGGIGLGGGEDLLGVGADIGIEAGVLMQGEVEIVRSRDGILQSVVVKEVLEGTVKGGLDGSVNVGVEEAGVVRSTLTFDMTDPNLQGVFGDEVSTGSVLENYATHRSAAGELVTVYEVSASSGGIGLPTASIESSAVLEESAGAFHRGPGSDAFRKLD